MRDSLITKLNRFSHMTFPISTGKNCLAQITPLTRVEWVRFVFNMGLNISRVRFYLLAGELYDHTSISALYIIWWSRCLPVLSVLPVKWVPKKLLLKNASFWSLSSPAWNRVIKVCFCRYFQFFGYVPYTV